MGWLQALLKKAGWRPDTDTPIAVEKIEIHQLEEWLEARLRECLARHNLDAATLEYLNQLKEKRWDVEHNLEEWERKIQALGISPLSRDTSSLFAETRAFLGIPSVIEKNSLPHVLRMNREMEIQLQQLQGKIQQSSFAYNFSYLLDRDARVERDQQVNPLLQALLDIDHMRKKVEDTIELSGYKALYQLCRHAKSVGKQYQESQASAKEFDQSNQKLLAVEQKHDEKDAELQALQQHHLYQDIRELRRKKQELLKALQQQEEQLEEFFLSLKPALQQYQKLVPDNSIVPRLVKGEQASQAFYEDSSGVVQVLKAMQRMLTAEKLTLPADQANTVMAALDRGIRTVLPEVEREHAACSSQLQQLQENKDFVQKLEEAQYRVDHFRQQVQRLRREIHLLDEEHSTQKAALEQQVKALKEDIKTVVGREVEIAVL